MNEVRVTDEAGLITRVVQRKKYVREVLDDYFRRNTE